MNMKKHVFLSAFLAAAVFTACGGSDGKKNDTSEDIALIEASTVEKSGDLVAVKKGPRYHERIPIYFKGSLREVFNDSNYVQYQYAERLGINPIESLHDAYFTSRPIVKVETGDHYEVDELTHSVPYLVPQAEKLLDDIGASFIDSLRNRGADGYKIMVTSLLRTPDTVKRLRRVNRNATDSSTHKFGTTFDLSWRRFACSDSTRTIHEGDLKNLLAEVLLDKRNEGRCLVKYEHKTACFHITTIK